MSFQNLISGADCAVQFNPLSQVVKHAEGDRSLQQDRIAGPSGTRLHHLSVTAGARPHEQELSGARQFFDVNARTVMAPPPPFIAAEMRNAMPGISDMALQEAWYAEQQHMAQIPEQMQSNSSWASEFRPSDPATSFQSHPMQGNTTMQFRSNSTDFYRMSNFATPGPQISAYPFVQDKGKGKSRDADFDADFTAAFDRLTTSMTETTTSSRIEEVDETATAKVGDADFDFGRHEPDSKEYEEELAKWEAEFSKNMNAERDELDSDYDYGTTMQQAWEDMHKSEELQKPVEYDPQGIPMLGDYTFETENKYMDPSSSASSPLKDAKELLEQNGSLSEAALLLEAAIQKGDLGKGGYEAWILLGETRSMDEREEAGMLALMQGVKLAEEAGDAGEGMMSLAISFTNESYERASHSTLLRWLRARYPSHPVPAETISAMETHSSWDTHEKVSELFLELARSQHAQNIVDPDVQIGLGVLYYTNGYYDRAKDCFESALSMRPGDYLLWNRLGSSLSNGSKPEEALGAYREALNIRPTYTRAIYNVGVACLNIGAHKEAAEHFLSGIASQESTKGATSDQLWQTLRRAFHSMDRPDLADLASPENRASLDVFRREGFEF